MPAVRFPVVAVAVVFSLPALLIFEPAYAQIATDSIGETTQIVIAGTRVQNRSALQTAVPVDSPFGRSGRFVHVRLSYDF